MSKRFQRGLVVGKFAPLHRGHELVIQRAFTDCEHVVLISYSKPELPGCEPHRRERWLRARFPKAKILVVTDELLRGQTPSRPGLVEIPHNDAPASVHRQFCGWLCLELLNATVDAVFTSEDYGNGFAEELTQYFRKFSATSPQVCHVLVDANRSEAPISGTQLRQAPHANRRWLAPEVYASFVQRVCLLGGESTGKSTLCQELAKEFGTIWVPEYGRRLWEEKQGQLVFDDMLQIASHQMADEEIAAGSANRFLFCDTSPLTTLFYSQHLFGQAAPELVRLAQRHYDTLVLCAPDFEFVQDGTRQPPSFRQQQHDWYLMQLAERQWPFVLVNGSVAERIRQVRHALLADSFR